MAVAFPERATRALADDAAVSPAVELDDKATELYGKMALLSDGNRGKAQLREEMIRAGVPFAVRVARHFHGRGEPLEDLVQVATVGLIKAVDGYDPERGPFSHYAGPTIRGEIKKHFRDRGWWVRVPRRLQEFKIELSRATQTLTHQLGRSPTVDDIAGLLGVDAEEVIEGMDLARAYHPVSLDAPVSKEGDAVDLGAMLGQRDHSLEGMADHMTLASLLPRLPQREQRILAMRFYGNMTQSQIATEIGISQMHVSRLLSQALAWLRQAMSIDDEPEWPGQTEAAGSGEASLLNVSVQRLPGGVTIVGVVGEVDLDVADGLRVTLCESVMADRPAWVRVDLSKVTLVDGVCAGVLAAASRVARHAGADFTLERPSRRVDEALRHVGLAELISQEPVSASRRASRG